MKKKPIREKDPLAVAMGQRMRALRIANEQREPGQWSQAKVAARLGEDRRKLENWEAGRAKPRPDRQLDIAKLYGVSVDYILGHTPQPTLFTAQQVSLHSDRQGRTAQEFRKASESLIRAPIYEWKSIHEWCTSGHLPDAKGFLLVSNTGMNAFVLIIEGDAMETDFPEGSRLICDPDVTATSGDYVIACINNNTSEVFRRLRIEAGTRLLLPCNAKYPTLAMTNGDRIVAVAMDHVRHLRDRSD